MNRKQLLRGLALVVVTALALACFAVWEPSYANAANWAYRETGREGTSADVFFVGPTAYRGEEGVYNWLDYDPVVKPKFIGAVTMEKGIYDTDARFFAPLYHQAAVNTAEMSQEERQPYYQLAYDDVRAAFDYYLKHDNAGRPIILAGFSQGAEMCIRLLEDCFADPALNARLVACYAIGWRFTQEELDANPHIRMAQGPDDTGVLVTYNSEVEQVTGSPIVPEGMKVLGINPLNWKTDGTPADRSLNKGACFTDYSGAITQELPQLTGAYQDPERGTLKLPDISQEEYPGKLFTGGVFHEYDYLFFYRNLQENVRLRLENYLAN